MSRSCGERGRRREGKERRQREKKERTIRKERKEEERGRDKEEENRWVVVECGEKEYKKKRGKETGRRREVC